MTRKTGSPPFHPGTPWGLFRFEAPEAGGAPAVADAPAAAEAGGEAPSWAGPSQEEWEGLQQQHAALVHALQQQYQTPQEQARFDPFSDDPDTVLRQIIREEMAPLHQTYQRIEDAEGQELAYDVIADNVSREGDFLHDGSKDLAFQLARGFLPQTVQKYGYGDRAAEAALEQACKHVRELEQTIGTKFYERQTNQLHTLAGARGEPGSSGPASQVPGSVFKRGDSVADRYFGG